MERLGTTPFGGGRMSARLFKWQAEAAERQEKLRRGEAGNATGRADKWQLLRALTEARSRFGLSDRTLCLLEALASFASERELDGSKPIIVFPSNRELSVRARGMAPATIRRHIAALVDAGFLFRRDSANGKRFCRRDDDGQVEDAFGFDLAPLALRAEEILGAAEEVRAEEKATRVLRSEITLHRRDISRIIEIALEEAREGDWMEYLAHLGSLAQKLGRRAALTELKAVRDELVMLRAKVENTYLESLEESELSANDSQNERQLQNSNTDPTLELNGHENEGGEAGTAETPAPERKQVVSLARLKRCCPQILDYAKDGIGGWTDLIRTAGLVRSMLGISPDAWRKACAAMGEQGAAIVIAAMLERADEIKSPGGYLRNLTAKAEKGAFSIFPMLQALERRRG